MPLTAQVYCLARVGGFVTQLIQALCPVSVSAMRREFLCPQQALPLAESSDKRRKAQRVSQKMAGENQVPLRFLF